MTTEEPSNEEPTNADPSPEGSEGGAESGSKMDNSNEYITVYLNEIRKEMQCPICLGIIRKTRTVMECLHRFCRECIDKSMRLGNNECPACRTHCASRRSLRDDPNFDSLIAALYDDIDKYEEEEMAILEEETFRNKQIQANIAETFKRQSDALAKRRNAKATAAAIVRKAQGKFRPTVTGPPGRRGGAGGRGGRRSRNSRQRELSPLEDESDYYEEEAPVEPRRTSNRKRQRPITFDSSLSLSIDESNGNSDDDMAYEHMSQNLERPKREGNGDGVVSWARGGSRSNSRYGALAGGSGRHIRCARATLLLEALTSAPNKGVEEFDVQFTLQPMKDAANPESGLPCLEKSHLCCSPRVSVQQLCSFLMSHDLFPVDTELEIVAEKARLKPVSPTASESAKMVDVLDNNVTLGDAYMTYWNKFNSLSLFYRRKMMQNAMAV